MVKETAGQEFLLTRNYYFEHFIILVRAAIPLSTIIYFKHYYMWVAGEGPTIEWSYLPRKIVREKRLFFRGHGDCIF